MTDDYVMVLRRPDGNYYMDDKNGYHVRWTLPSFSRREIRIVLRDPTKRELILAHQNYIGYRFKLPEWKKHYTYFVESLTYLSLHVPLMKTRTVFKRVLDMVLEQGPERPTLPAFNAIRKPLKIQQWREGVHVSAKKSGLGALKKEVWLPQPDAPKFHEPCGICYDELSPDHMETECKHSFHVTCLQQWFSHSAHTTCPSCRQKCDPELYI
jgi:hypothetical protein